MELYKGKYWTVIFQDWNQDFPGTCYITSEKEKLSDLLPEEWVELGILEKELERITGLLFNSTMCNFCCFMNTSYQNKTTPVLHFCFFPRYKNKVKIGNTEYEDKHFGDNFFRYDREQYKKQKDLFSQEDKMYIYNSMKAEWSIKN